MVDVESEVARGSTIERGWEFFMKMKITSLRESIGALCGVWHSQGLFCIFHGIWGR